MYFRHTPRVAVIQYKADSAGQYVSRDFKIFLYIFRCYSCVNSEYNIHQALNMNTRCCHQDSLCNVDDLPMLLKEHIHIFWDTLDNLGIEDMEMYNPKELFYKELAADLRACGRGYMSSALYIDPENNKEKIKEHQREIVNHLVECCSCGDLLDALATDESGEKEDFLEYISKKDEYWVITGGLLEMFESGAVEKGMYDSILGSARFLRKCIEEYSFSSAGDFITCYPRYLFSGLTMTPSEIKDILLCYPRYTLFSSTIESDYDSVVSVDFRPEDIIEHQKEISEIHPGIAKIAEAVHNADWTEVSKYLSCQGEITRDTKVTISVSVPLESFASEHDMCDIYGPPHLTATIMPSFWFYKSHDIGQVYLSEKSYLKHMLGTNHSKSFFNSFGGNISTKDLHRILDIFAVYGSSVFVDSDEVKLEKRMGPKSAR